MKISISGLPQFNFSLSFIQLQVLLRCVEARYGANAYGASAASPVGPLLTKWSGRVTLGLAIFASCVEIGHAAELLENDQREEVADLDDVMVSVRDELLSAFDQAATVMNNSVVRWTADCNVDTPHSDAASQPLCPA